MSRRSILRIIGDTINLLRPTGSITAVITVSGNLYTVTTDTTGLSIGDWIIIDNRKGRVKSTTPTQFVAHFTRSIDLNSVIWRGATPYYDSGDENMLENYLQQEANDEAITPLIILLEPFKRNVSSLDKTSGIGENAKLVILVLDTFDTEWIKSEQFYINKIENLEDLAHTIVKNWNNNVYVQTPLLENDGYVKTSYTGKNIFGKNLCGVRLEIELNINERYFDECYPYEPPTLLIDQD